MWNEERTEDAFIKQGLKPLKKWFVSGHFYLTYKIGFYPLEKTKLLIRKAGRSQFSPGERSALERLFIIPLSLNFFFDKHPSSRTIVCMGSALCLKADREQGLFRYVKQCVFKFPLSIIKTVCFVLQSDNSKPTLRSLEHLLKPTRNMCDLGRAHQITQLDLSTFSVSAQA